MGAHDSVLNRLDNLIQMWTQKATQVSKIEQSLVNFGQVGQRYLASPHNVQVEQLIVGGEDITDMGDIGVWL